MVVAFYSRVIPPLKRFVDANYDLRRDSQQKVESYFHEIVIHKARNVFVERKVEITFAGRFTLFESLALLRR